MRSIIAASALVLAMTSTVNAQDMFARMEAPQDEGASTIVIDALTATDDGFVAIFDNHNGVIGELLGAAAVREGANTETRVTLGRPVQRDVIAMLFVGPDFSDPSKAVDSVEIDIEG